MEDDLFKERHALEKCKAQDMLAQQEQRDLSAANQALHAKLRLLEERLTHSHEENGLLQIQILALKSSTLELRCA